MVEFLEALEKSLGGVPEVFIKSEPPWSLEGAECFRVRVVFKSFWSELILTKDAFKDERVCAEFVAWDYKTKRRQAEAQLQVERGRV